MSEVTGQNLTKFVHDVAESSPCNILKRLYDHLGPSPWSNAIVKSGGDGWQSRRIASLPKLIGNHSNVL